MVWIEKTDGLISMIQHGRLGRPMLCGQAWCGWSQCGEEIEQAGVYQNRRVRSGVWKWYNGKFGKVKTCKMAPCWPYYPYNENRERTNNAFKAAVAAWNALTDEEREAYNVLNAGKLKCGYNYFIKQELHG